MRLTFLTAIFLLLATYTGSAATTNADTAFDTFKTLEGVWTIQSDAKTLPIRMTYEIGSKGAVIEERFGKELSVFYRDGTALEMTHFCNAGNAPRLKLQTVSRPEVLEFDMVDITNLKSPDAAHVQKIIYRMINADRFDLEIVWQENNAQTSEKYTLTRSR